MSPPQNSSYVGFRSNVRMTLILLQGSQGVKGTRHPTTADKAPWLRPATVGRLSRTGPSSSVTGHYTGSLVLSTPRALRTLSRSGGNVAHALYALHDKSPDFPCQTLTTQYSTYSCLPRRLSVITMTISRPSFNSCYHTAPTPS
jgi:hypothetical protein